MKHTIEQLKKAEDSLPKDIKEAISSTDFIYTVQDISKKYNLHIDKMGELSDEISLVMLGFTHPADFTKNIKNRLSVDENTAHEITKEVNEKIFKPIKESLMEIHKKKDSSIAEQMGNEVVEQNNEEELDRKKILEEIEDTPKHQPLSETPTQKINTKDKETFKQGEQTSEPTSPVEMPVDTPKNNEGISENTNENKTKDIVEEKLSQPFKIQKSETEHKAKETPSATTDGGYKDVDPYHEPIE